MIRVSISANGIWDFNKTGQDDPGSGIGSVTRSGGDERSRPFSFMRLLHL